MITQQKLNKWYIEAQNYIILIIDIALSVF